MKALNFGALHGLLILCVGVLPIAGFAAVHDLHHPGGACINCEIGSIDAPGDCDTDFCAGAAASCGSHHVFSMIATGLPNPSAAPSGGTDARRAKDGLTAPPPSRIDRPPIT